MIINVLFGQKNVDGTITVRNVHNDQTTSSVPEVYILKTFWASNRNFCCSQNKKKKSIFSIQTLFKGKVCMGSEN